MLELGFLIIAITSELVLGFVVYLRDRNSATNKSFCALTIGIAAWTLSVYINNHTQDFSTALFWARMVFAVTFFTGWSLVSFSSSFPKKKSKYPISLYLVFSVVVIAFAAMSLFTNMVVYTVQLLPWGTNVVSGSMYFVFVAYMMIAVFVSIVNLSLKFLRSESIEKVQLKYLLLGFCLTAIIAINTNLVLPLISGTNEFAMFGCYSMIILIGFTSYSIIKHRLMDIKLVVVRSAIYTLMIIGIAGFFVLLVSIARSKYGSSYGINQDALFVIAGLIVAFGFQPIKKVLENLTDRLFFKKRYDPQKLLGTLTVALSSMIDLDKASILVAKILKKEMRLSRAAIVLYGGREKERVFGFGFRISESSLAEILNV